MRTPGGVLAPEVGGGESASSGWRARVPLAVVRGRGWVETGAVADWRATAGCRDVVAGGRRLGSLPHDGRLGWHRAATRRVAEGTSVVRGAAALRARRWSSWWCRWEGGGQGHGCGCHTAGGRAVKLACAVEAGIAWSRVCHQQWRVWPFAAVVLTVVCIQWVRWPCIHSGCLRGTAGRWFGTRQSRCWSADWER